jgi:hypothetical protein
MTKKDYIALVKEFNLTYDVATTSAYFNEYPICGYRPDRSNFGTNDWSSKSLIIFENYSEHLNEYGHYSGVYQDKFATKVEEARQLISNQIVSIKNKYINARLEKMEKDF